VFAGRIAVLSFLAFCSNIFAQTREYERGEIVASCDDTLTAEIREVKDSYDFTDTGIHDKRMSKKEKSRKEEIIRSFLSEHDVREKDEIIYKKEIIRITAWIEETKLTKKTTTCKNFREEIVTLHDKKGRLISSKHYKWNGLMLIQTIDDGFVRNIIPGETCCDFTIIESSGDSVSFHLNPKKQLDNSIKIRNNSDFMAYMRNDPKIPYMRNHPKISKLEGVMYDAIIYQWHSYCKKYYEEHKTIGTSNDSDFFHFYTEEEPGISTKDDSNFLSRILLYKYYVIIIICIVIINIAIIYKKRKRDKK
jgi:hypothetical protein